MHECPAYFKLFIYDAGPHASPAGTSGAFVRICVRAQKKPQIIAVACGYIQGRHQPLPGGSQVSEARPGAPFAFPVWLTLTCHVLVESLSSHADSLKVIGRALSG
jgi:hypothetical protein